MILCCPLKSMCLFSFFLLSPLIKIPSPKLHHAPSVFFFCFFFLNPINAGYSDVCTLYIRHDDVQGTLLRTNPSRRPRQFKGVALSKHYHIIWASRRLVNKWCRSLLCDGAQVGDRRLCSASMSRWRQRQETERLTFDSSEDSAALYQGRTHRPQSCPQCGDVRNNRITLPQSGSTSRPGCNWISECPTTTC